MDEATRRAAVASMEQYERSLEESIFREFYGTTGIPPAYDRQPVGTVIDSSDGCANVLIGYTPTAASTFTTSDSTSFSVPQPPIVLDDFSAGAAKEYADLASRATAAKMQIKNLRSSAGILKADIKRELEKLDETPAPPSRARVIAGKVANYLKILAAGWLLSKLVPLAFNLLS